MASIFCIFSWNGISHIHILLLYSNEDRRYSVPPNFPACFHPSGVLKFGRNKKDGPEWMFQTSETHERQLWKLGTLLPCLITFWKRVYPLDRSWHVLVGQKQFEQKLLTTMGIVCF
uniref:Hexosyltransferase n=1 Tax=Tanacetum cinerariifolium TaxID=118510 RepID=A0A699H2P5_TANCI|nr:hypothetical protein [Tanacetum cinerariifolium]